MSDNRRNLTFRIFVTKIKILKISTQQQIFAVLTTKQEGNSASWTTQNKMVSIPISNTFVFSFSYFTKAFCCRYHYNAFGQSNYNLGAISIALSRHILRVPIASKWYLNEKYKEIFFSSYLPYLVACPTQRSISISEQLIAFRCYEALYSDDLFV